MGDSNPTPSLLPPAAGHLRASSRQHRAASGSPTRQRPSDDILSQRDPAAVLMALRNPTGSLRRCMDAATPTEQSFAMRAAVSGRNIQYWLEEVSQWPWPTGSASEGFELPLLARRAPFEGASSVSPSGPAGQGLWMGSLLAADVARYDDRIDAILQEIDDLELEEIKSHVLHHHILPLSRPCTPMSDSARSDSSSCGYNRMDDLAALITTVVLRALPNLDRLMRLMNAWSIRIQVLMRVPAMLASLDDAEAAIRSACEATQARNRAAVSPRDATLTKKDFIIEKLVIEKKIAAASRILDFMLDTLEGRDETVPRRWIRRMDVIVDDYSMWVAACERKIGEAALAALIKERLATRRPTQDASQPPRPTEDELPPAVLPPAETGPGSALGKRQMPGLAHDRNQEDADLDSPEFSEEDETIRVVVDNSLPEVSISAYPVAKEPIRAEPALPHEDFILPKTESDPVRAEQQNANSPVEEEISRRDASSPVEEAVSQQDASAPVEAEISQQDGPAEDGLPDQVVAVTNDNHVPPAPVPIDSGAGSHDNEGFVPAASTAGGLRSGPAYVLEDSVEGDYQQPEEESSPGGEDQHLSSRSSAASLRSQSSVLLRHEARDQTPSASPVSAVLRETAAEGELESGDLLEARSSPDLPRAQDTTTDEVPRDDISSPSSSPPDFRLSTRSTVTFNDMPTVTEIPDVESPPQTPLESSFFPDSDTPQDMGSPISPGRMSVTSDDDQLQQQISEILESIPAKIHLSSQPTPLNHLNPPEFQLPQRLKSKQVDTVRSHSSLSSRAATPSFLLAPAYARNPRPRHQRGNQEIKLYHLSRSTGEAPIKLFIRLVGENGERVMVRVGGGWADLGEYLKEYASHHGRRSKNGNDSKIEVRDLPALSSGSKPNVGSSPPSRPASALDSPMTPLNVRKTRKLPATGSSGSEDGAVPPPPKNSISNNPKTPLTTAAGTVAGTVAGTTAGTAAGTTAKPDTPSSGASTRSRSSSRLSWTEDDSLLGMSGPKTKNVEMSEESRAWVESVKERVRLASGERKPSAESAALEGKFGEMGKVGGTKRLFRKG